MSAITVGSALLLFAACSPTNIQSVKPPPVKSTATTLSIVTPAPQTKMPFLATQIAVGTGLTVAIDLTGKVWSWDSNGDTNAINPPSLVHGVTASIANERVTIAAGMQHACVVTGDGTISCWGDNRSGQLGDGTVLTRNRPVTVTLPLPALAVGVHRNRSCALLANGSVACWGQKAKSFHECQSSSSYPDIPINATPSLIDGIRNATQLAVGASHVCVVNTDETVSCVGDNGWGQSTGVPGSSVPPTVVPGISKAVQISASGVFSCATLRDGTTHCWGQHKCPTGSATCSQSASPLLDQVSTAKLGGACNVCAVRTDGSVSCWGTNWSNQGGQRGPAFLHDSQVIAGLASTTTIAVGVVHACAIKENSSVWCWGQGFGFSPRRIRWNGPTIRQSHDESDTELTDILSKTRRLNPGQWIDRDETGSPMIVPELSCPAGTEARHGRPKWASESWDWEQWRTEAAWCVLADSNKKTPVRHGPFVAHGGRIDTITGNFSNGKPNGKWRSWTNDKQYFSWERSYRKGKLSGRCQVQFPRRERRVFRPNVYPHSSIYRDGLRHGAWSLATPNAIISGEFSSGVPVGVWKVGTHSVNLDHVAKRKASSRSDILLTGNIENISAKTLVIIAGSARTITTMTTDKGSFFARLPKGSYTIVALHPTTNRAAIQEVDVRKTKKRVTLRMLPSPIWAICP